MAINVVSIKSNGEKRGYNVTVADDATGKIYSGVFYDTPKGREKFKTTLFADIAAENQKLAIIDGIKIELNADLATPPVGDSLILHLDPSADRGGETLTDLSGNNSPGVLIDDVNWVPASGKRGLALGFDSTAPAIQYVEFDNAIIPVSSDWTVLSWGLWKGASGNGEDVRGAIWSNSRWWDPTFTGILLRRSMASQALHLEWGDGVSNNDIDLYTDMEGNVNKWYHIAIVYRTAITEMRGYTNGELVSPVRTTTAYIDTLFNFQIGSSQINTAQSRWNGEVGEIRVYNRALSADEIHRIYIMGL